jgi:hypothetical protein
MIFSILPGRKIVHAATGGPARRIKMAIRERLPLQNYVVYDTYESKIDDGIKYRVAVGLQCPHCKVISDYLAHRERVDCRHCGLKIFRVGEALECELVVS